MRRERGNHVAQEFFFVVRANMLEHIECVNSVELSGDRGFEQVVHEAGERPFSAHAPVDVLDEDRIEIDRGELSHLLPNDPGREGVGASDLEHAPAPAHHLGYKFVTRKGEGQALGVIVPGLASHQSEAFEAFLLEFVEDWFVLRLAGPTPNPTFPCPAPTELAGRFSRPEWLQTGSCQWPICAPTN